MKCIRDDVMWDNHTSFPAPPHTTSQLFSSVTLHSLAHFSSSWAAPASRLWVGGDLGVWQRRPLPSTGRVEQYNASLFNSSSSRAEEFDITTILSRYNERNCECALIIMCYCCMVMRTKFLRRDWIVHALSLFQGPYDFRLHKLSRLSCNQNAAGLGTRLQWNFLMWTPWGPGKVSCIERCPHFRNKYIIKIAYLGHGKVSLSPYFRGVL